MNISEFTIKTNNIKGVAGCWGKIKVEIYHKDSKIGEYERNYHAYAEATFCPFEQDGKFYALYSKDYVATRVMELPSCKDICGDELHSSGFCPTSYYVPKESNGKFGFVSGCVWGDDSSWKIQYLDLSKINEGKFTNDSRFGYLQLPDNLSLEQAVDAEYCDEGIIKICSFDYYHPNLSKDEILFDKISGQIYPGGSTKKLIKYLEDNFCKECGYFNKPRKGITDDPFACKCAK